MPKKKRSLKELIEHYEQQERYWSAKSEEWRKKAAHAQARADELRQQVSEANSA